MVCNKVLSILSADRLSEYLVVLAEATYEEAEMYCRDRGAFLPVVSVELYIHFPYTFPQNAMGFLEDDGNRGFMLRDLLFLLFC